MTFAFEIDLDIDQNEKPRSFKNVEEIIAQSYSQMNKEYDKMRKRSNSLSKKEEEIKLKLNDISMKLDNSGKDIEKQMN